MRRINDREVELTEEEVIISEIHSRLMDQGFNQGNATRLMLGGMVEPTLRSDAPRLEAIDPEFWFYLNE